MVKFFDHLLVNIRVDGAVEEYDRMELRKRNQVQVFAQPWHADDSFRFAVYGYHLEGCHVFTNVL